MKEFRFRKMGIANVFGDSPVRTFFRSVFVEALAEDRPPFVLHGLEVAGKLRAVTGSSRSGKRLICTCVADDELGHTSPGDFLFFDNLRRPRDRLRCS
jgi:CelD/BcsL family acetyltransferase involved in cellulose biosynthesis